MHVYWCRTRARKRVSALWWDCHGIGLEHFLNGETSPVLDYAQDPRRSRWRRRVIRAGIVVSLALLFAVVRHYWAPISLRASQIYWARQCARFTAPADLPLVVSDLRKIAERTSDANYVSDRGRSRSPLVFQPYCWGRFRQSAGIPQSFFGSVDETVFLGELRTPAGKRRIVHVLSWYNNARKLPSGLESTVVEPPTLTSPARMLCKPPGGRAAAGFFTLAVLSFGQIDPADPSHFTIAWRTADEQFGVRIRDQRRGVIHGYLLDNDRIRFVCRDDHTTGPSTSR